MYIQSLRLFEHFQISPYLLVSSVNLLPALIVHRSGISCENIVILLEELTGLLAFDSRFRNVAQGLTEERVELLGFIVYR